MPTLAVQLAGGQEVVSDFFLDTDSKIGDLADAAGCQLAVASSRCVLLSPSGDCMAHSLTCLGHQSRRRRRRHRLGDGPSTGLREPMWLGLRCNEAGRFRRHVERCRSGRQLKKGEVRADWRCRSRGRHLFRCCRREARRLRGHLGGRLQIVAATPTR